MPLGLNNRTLGGATFGQQEGVEDAYGLSNIGLLVRAWGKVTKMEQTTTPAKPTWLKIDDGYGVDVKAELSTGISGVSVGNCIVVTGASSCRKDGSVLKRLLRVRMQSDIQVVPNP